jgi:hypothetical protein
MLHENAHIYLIARQHLHDPSFLSLKLTANLLTFRYKLTKST